jgi:hypothetical protein
MTAFINVCRFTPTAGGTADWTYSSAVTGYQSPASAGIVNGGTYKYRAESSDLTQWELGQGTYNTGTGVLARTTVLYNSSGTGTGAGQSGAGSKISFSTTPQVAIVALAEDLPSLTKANTFTDIITISKNTSALPSAGSFAAAAIFNGANADTVGSDIILQSFNNSNGFAQPTVRYMKTRGTAASPAAVQSGDFIGANFAYGYATSVSSDYVSTAGAGFIMTATENYTTAAAGARLDLYATPTGTASVARAASVGAGVMVGTTTDPGAGAILATASIKSNGASGGVGYATGAGGTVTQLTNKTTGVTLNALCGAITMNAAALASGAVASFVLTNSTIAGTDVLILNHISTGAFGSYVFNARAAAGSATIDVRNNTGGTLTDAVVIQFAVIKAVNS